MVRALFFIFKQFTRIAVSDDIFWFSCGLDHALYIQTSDKGIVIKGYIDATLLSVVVAFRHHMNSVAFLNVIRHYDIYKSV